MKLIRIISIICIIVSIGLLFLSTYLFQERTKLISNIVIGLSMSTCILNLIYSFKNYKNKI